METDDANWGSNDYTIDWDMDQETDQLIDTPPTKTTSTTSIKTADTSPIQTTSTISIQTAKYLHQSTDSHHLTNPDHEHPTSPNHGVLRNTFVIPTKLISCTMNDVIGIGKPQFDDRNGHDDYVLYTDDVSGMLEEAYQSHKYDTQLFPLVISENGNACFQHNPPVPGPPKILGNFLGRPAASIA